MKGIFYEYLKTDYPDKYPELMKKFELYLELLLSANRRINLVSRTTREEEYWTIHFLDSLLPCGNIDLTSSKVLDFGTGGGLPGIPLKIVFPDASFYFLDSKQKKIEALKNIIKKLDLMECFTIVSRLEDLGGKWLGYFNYIVSRSVRLTPRYLKKMDALLAENGQIILYKGSRMDDLSFVREYLTVDISHPEIGKRTLIIIKKQDIK